MLERGYDTGAVRWSLQVVEQGAQLGRPRDTWDFDETVTVAQHADEAPEDFAQRVAARVAASDKPGRALEAATIFIGGATGPGLATARRHMAAAIAERVCGTSQSGDMVLVSSARAPEVQRELFELADHLLIAGYGQGVAVRITDA